MSRMIEPGPEFGDLFHSFKHTAYRLEVHDEYQASSETAALAQFAAGEEVDMAWYDNWVKLIAESTAAGKQFARVRVVTVPLTTYSQFGIFCSGFTNRVGEVTRYLAREDAADLPNYDYWLLDSSMLLRMQFADDMEFLGGEVIEDPAEVVAHNALRDAAWHLAVSRDEFDAKINDGQHQL